MKKSIFLFVCIFLCGCGAGPLERPIQEDLNSELASKTLNPEIQLSFGKHDVTGKNLGTYVSNKKTYSPSKSPEYACQVAFLSAVKSLQDRAEREGGNAVVNIHSYYKKVPKWSDTTYHCQDGAYLTGVALRGTVVKQ
ncbi:MAG: hypothetical protein J5714_00045 [Alphaproteobacteria bacterium]|nr:hypothetical protein [Alphaproteobacteria bacterium]